MKKTLSALITLILLFNLNLLLADSVFVQPNDKTVTIGVVLPPPSQPWLAACADSAKKAGKLLGDKCKLIILNSAKDSANQINEVEDLITKKVDGIVLLAIEGAPLTPVAAKAKNKGIPLASVSRLITSNDYAVKIEGDNQLVGRMAADYIANRLEGKGKVALITGVPGSSDSLDRENAFKEEMKKFPDIKIAADLPGYFVTEKGMSVMENILTANPDLNAVYALNDAMALGADMAVKARGLTDKVFIIGSDGTKEMFNRIKNGNSSCEATITYPPSMTGDAVLFIYSALQNRGLPGTFEPSIPISYKVSSFLITKDNVEKYQNLAF